MPTPDPALDELIELKRKLTLAQPTMAVSLTWYPAEPKFCSIAWTDYTSPDGRAIMERAPTEVECVQGFLARPDVQALLAPSGPT